MTSRPRLCPECGAALPTDAPRDLCPACLLRVGAADEAAEPKRDQGGAQGPTRGLGDYELLEELGRGGMGVVFRARQRSLNRLVAVKLLLHGRFSDPVFVERFYAEAETAARLEHPNIVPIYEVGQPGDQPYYAMRLVEGRNLASELASGPMAPKQAARLTATLARAVHYAHQRGVLHRDLKPHNILLDARREPHLTDFGLARLLEDETGLALSTAVVGSPPFMAPEQATGQVRQLTTAADVYGLGAVLYALLTGKPPFAGDSPVEVIRKVADEEPAPPNQVLRSVQLDRPQGLPTIDQDLETICLKCLQKDPSKRYGSAEALASDLEHWLRAEPIQARPVSQFERTWLWCRRQPVRAGLIAALVLVFGLGTMGVLWQWRQARFNARAAERREYAANIALAQSFIEQQEFNKARDILNFRTPERYRSWEWGWLQRNCNQDLMTLSAEGPGLMVAAFSPDTRLLATAGFSETIWLWDAETGRKVRPLRGHTADVAHLAFSPDGRWLASAGWWDRTARLWEVATGRSLRILPHPGSVTHVAFSPDGHQLVTACEDQKVRVWDAATGLATERSATYGDSVYCAEFSPDGERVAFSGGWYMWGESLDTSVRIWNLASGEIDALQGHREDACWCAWSPKGDLLASGGWDGRIILWDPDAKRRLRVLESVENQGPVLSMAFSPNGKYLAATGGSVPRIAPKAQVFDLRTGRLVRELAGHSGPLPGVAFSSDNRRLATASTDGTAKVWPVEPLPSSITLEGHDQTVWTATFAQDGRRLATGSFDLTVRIWDARTGGSLQTIPAGIPAVSLAFNPRGEKLVTVGPDNTARVWRIAPGAEPADTELLCLRGHTRAVMCVTWSADDQWIATGSKDQTVRIWRAGTGAELRVLRGHQSAVLAVAGSPRGETLASGDMGGCVRLWESKTGRSVRNIIPSTNPVLSLAFGPMGGLLAAGLADHTVRLFDLRDGQELRQFEGHANGVTALSFSPDGQRLLTASGGTNLYDNVNREFQVRFWDVSSGYQLLSLIAHTNVVCAAAFSPDGRRVVTGSSDGTARIWTAFPWRVGDYPGDPRQVFADRIESYKREFWRSNQVQRPPGDTARHWTRHTVGDLNLPAAGTKTRPLLPIPPRDAQCGPDQLDLTKYYNVALNESWQPLGSVFQLDMSLGELPPGLHVFSGVRFDVRGLIQLRRAAPDCELFPMEVRIPVHRKFSRLQVLHGTSSEWDGHGDGTSIAAFVLQYATGAKAEIPIVHGEHLRSQGAGPSADCAQGVVAWTSPADGALRAVARIYVSALTNPKPELEVVRIDYLSKLTRCAPFLVALTVE